MKQNAIVLSIILLFSFPALGMSAAPAPKEPAYAGVSVCQECHKEQTLSMSRTPHWKKAIKDSPLSDKGCESCHGSGASHVREGGGTTKDLITFTKKEKAQQKTEVCFSCHQNSRQVASFDLGVHKRNDVTCSDCHTVHNSAVHNLKTNQPELCLACHKDMRNQIKKQSHHPIQEGKVKCTDCHSPHGSMGPKMVKAESVQDLCYKCHTEKRGPYAFEHPPVVENCAICHETHGSNHTGLLKSKSPLLCQGCHDSGSHPTRAYTYQHGFIGDATANKNKFYARGCLNCHGNIHGSNRSAGFER